MKLRSKTTFLIAGFSAAFLTVACGTSLYGVFAKKETRESRLEDAKIALDDGDFSAARSILADLWSDEKDSDVAQLYVISMLGTVDLNIFTLVKKTIELTDDTATNLTPRQIYSNFPSRTSAAGGKKNDNPGNDIVDKISQVLPTNLNNVNVTNTLKRSISVLADAPNANAVMPLTCFVGAIYTNLVVSSIQTTMTDLQTSMQSNISKLNTGCTTTQGAEAGNSIKESLEALSDVTAAMDELVTSASGCLGAEAAVNSIKTSLDNLYAKADTGCSIPSTGNIGGYSFPTCASEFITAAGGSNSQAGDKALDGCEIFVNCVGTGSQCF